MSIPLSRLDYACDPNSLPVQNLREEIERKAGLSIDTIEFCLWPSRYGHGFRHCAYIQGMSPDEEAPEFIATGRNYVCALNGLAEELGVELERDSIATTELEQAS